MYSKAKSAAHFLRINKVIWLLTFTDIFSWGLYFSITALTGIYLANKLGANAIQTVGIGASVYYIVRALTQIPIGIITDRIKRDRDDILFLTTGNMLIGLPLLFYPIIQVSLVYFVFQGIIGLGAAMNLVTWRKLFAKNLDKGREGVSYAVYDTIMSIATAVISLFTGVVANINADFFDGVMMFIGVAIMLSSILPALIFDINDRKSID